jgi:hypothetical protein
VEIAALAVVQVRARIAPMKTTTEKAAEALDLLPEEMREPAVAYLLEQAEKFRILKEQIDEGIADVAAGRVSEWDFEKFLRDAQNSKIK